MTASGRPRAITSSATVPVTYDLVTTSAAVDNGVLLVPTGAASITVVGRGFGQSSSYSSLVRFGGTGLGCLSLDGGHRNSRQDDPDG